MQIPRSSRRAERPIRIGDLVRVRRARWRIVRTRAYGECELITLRGLSPPVTGLERSVLIPFDLVEPIEHRGGLRIVRVARWRRACRAVIAADGPPGSLLAARTARIDLLPHQLEPALAVLRGMGTRLLLADEVGLGKTIQAGLVIAELLARGAIERVLVLTPPGLREQWRRELAERFAVAADDAAARSLRGRAAVLPLGVNPWLASSTAIASIDYVKRPEVLPAATAGRWDLVVIDEAHTCAGDSDRRAAMHALAGRAPYVLLLSATPHNGDPASFSALCGFGAHDGDRPLLVFRRTRADAGIGTARRVHMLSVRLTSAEAGMHTSLQRYTDAVRSERRGANALLALSVLHKRGLSSAWSLAQSVERRLAAMSAADTAGPGQLILPLDDPHGERISADEAPAWPADLRLADAEHERRLLTALLASARAAAAKESKLAALARLLRRARQPALIFTEYRDTLLHVRHQCARQAMVLHGGLSPDERSAVLDAFAREPRALLLATDAAAEGLNLHARCRLVVNLELPWNPMRLEQRIGRVDRIGQRHIVHAFHLIGKGTGETSLLARLRARVAAAQADIGAPDPFADHEAVIAELVIASRGSIQ